MFLEYFVWYLSVNQLRSSDANSTKHRAVTVAVFYHRHGNAQIHCSGYIMCVRALIHTGLYIMNTYILENKNANEDRLLIS